MSSQKEEIRFQISNNLRFERNRDKVLVLQKAIAILNNVESFDKFLDKCNEAQDNEFPHLWSRIIIAAKNPDLFRFF